MAARGGSWKTIGTLFVVTMACVAGKDAVQASKAGDASRATRAALSGAMDTTPPREKAAAATFGSAAADGGTRPAARKEGGKHQMAQALAVAAMAVGDISGSVARAASALGPTGAASKVPEAELGGSHVVRLVGSTESKSKTPAAWVETGESFEDALAAQWLDLGEVHVAKYAITHGADADLAPVDVRASTEAALAGSMETKDAKFSGAREQASVGTADALAGAMEPMLKAPKEPLPDGSWPAKDIHKSTVGALAGVDSIWWCRFGCRLCSVRGLKPPSRRVVGCGSYLIEKTAAAAAPANRSAN